MALRLTAVWHPRQDCSVLRCAVVRPLGVRLNGVAQPHRRHHELVLTQLCLAQMCEAALELGVPDALPGCQGIGEDLELTLKTLRRRMACASSIVVVAPRTGDFDLVARILFEAIILLTAFSIKIFSIRRRLIDDGLLDQLLLLLL